MKKEETLINGREFLKGIGIFLLFYAFPTFYYLVFHSLSTSSNKIISSLTALVGEILTVALFIYLNKDKLKGCINNFKDNKPEYTDVMIKFYILGYFLMIVSNLIITAILGLGISGNETSVRENLMIYPLYYIPAACLLGPITEELAFRVSFKKAFNKKWLFIVFTSLLFASAHIFSSYTGLKDFIYLIPYSTLSFALAIIYAKTDNPLTNILTHIFHNTVTVVLYLIIL